MAETANQVVLSIKEYIDLRIQGSIAEQGRNCGSGSINTHIIWLLVALAAFIAGTAICRLKKPRVDGAAIRGHTITTQPMAVPRNVIEQIFGTSAFGGPSTDDDDAGAQPRRE
jgi:hypothetical protein